MSGAALERVRVVLVETSHPGNIGAAARALKTMGLRRLALVRPKSFPSAQASAQAAGADDVLHEARVHDSLEEALAGCVRVYGASARDRRRIAWPVLGPREAVAQALGYAAGAEVALVFGRESSGLTNAELDRCHAMLHIPTVEAFSSLNLAAAVQVVAWELRAAVLTGVEGVREHLPAELPEAEQMERFYTRLEATLDAIGFLDPRAPRALMRRLRRLYNRARPDCTELDILHGILSATARSAGRRPE